jgi:L-ascorbate metabolism protein UlaG (beta-lactamase superfamily)
MRRYANLDPRHVPHGLGAVLRWSFWNRISGARRIAPLGPPAPSVAPDLTAVNDPNGPPRVTWIGHASFLVSLDGVSVLVDPVFSRRIGGVIARHGVPGLLPSHLPRIDALLITHNHYDHLDAPSIDALPREVPVLVPEGLGPWFARRRFARVREMRWWDSASAGPLRVTFVPARHWSRRFPWDTNRSWWGGYVVEGEGATLYHAGDSAWFDGFAAIGARFPAIDLAILPVGAYEPAWFMEWHHLNPEQAGEAFQALGARAMIPAHWGTFRLTDEPLSEPADRIARWWEFRKPAGSLHRMAVGETLALAGGGPAGTSRQGASGRVWISTR